MWSKKRHSIITAIISPFLKTYFRFKFNYKVKKEKLPDEGAIILSNHSTFWDPFFISVKFNKPIYYMCSIHMFQNKFLGKLIKFLVAPIPKEKNNKSDISAVRSCLKIAKENGSVCIFPEGNRTFDGRLCNIEDSIVRLVKHLKKPLIICNIVGGYGSDPRWSNANRKGKLQVEIKKMYPFEEIKDMDNDELYEKIVADLTVDEFSLNVPFKSKKRAECLESILHICPICKGEHTLYSKGNMLYCSACGAEVEYTENLTFSCENRDFPFTYAYEWYDYQVDIMKNRNFEKAQLIYSDFVDIYKPRLFQKREALGNGDIRFFEDRFEFDLNKKSFKFSLDEVDDITLIGNKIMDIYIDGVTYRIIGEHKTNLIKYMHMFYILKEKRTEKVNGFIGI